MGLTREQKRLVAMDAQILELKYLYEREVQREIVLDKHTLLLSRGFKYRIEKLERARRILAASMETRFSKEATYQVELAIRKNNLLEEEEELERLRKEITRLATEMVTNPTEQLIYEFKELTREIPRQNMRIRNKKRALNNWLLADSCRISNESTRVSKAYNAEKDADKIHGALGNNDIVATAIAHREEVAKYENPLEADPRWETKPSNKETQIPFNLLDNPIEDASGTSLEFKQTVILSTDSDEVAETPVRKRIIID